MGSCTLLSLLMAIAALTGTSLGNADIVAHDVFGTVGSSVLFPPVRIDQDTAYELKIGDILVVFLHGTHTVREPYARRGEFFPGNGTFLLRNLRREDSGTYEHWVNMTISGKVNLQVIERVTKPNLSRENLREYVLLECTVSGDGPLHVSILKDWKVIINETLTRKDGVTNLTVHCGDPDSAGIYTCSSSNPVSSEISTVIELRPTASDLELISAHVITTMTIHSALLFTRIALLYLYKRIRNLQKKQQPKGAADKGQGRTAEAVFQAITYTGYLLGSLCELAAVIISRIGDFIPGPWCYIPTAVFLCLVLCRIPYFLERYKDIPSRVTFICGLFTQTSDFLFVPAFCGYMIYVFSNEHYSGPCGLRERDRQRWSSAAASYGLVWIILSAVFYGCIVRNEKKEECELTEVRYALVPPVLGVGIPDDAPSDTGEPEQIPLPQEHYLELSVETPDESLGTPGGVPACGGPLDAEGAPGESCSLIVESEELCCHRDRVANG